MMKLCKNEDKTNIELYKESFNSIEKRIGLGLITIFFVDFDLGVS